MYFDNKGLELIRLNTILRNEGVKSELPDQFRNDETPSIVYSLGSTIRNKILNYKDTVQNIDLSDSETFGTGLQTCGCSSSTFVDQNHGHVVTGDLRLIENNNLRNLIQKGPNYREPRTINWNRNRKIIEDGLDACSSRFISVDNNLTDYDLIPWKTEVLNKVDEKIRLLRRKLKFRKLSPVLKRPEVVDYLENLQKHFVLVLIDKASSNIAIICKKYYVETILKEIGYIGPGNSSTYEKVSKSKDEIIEENCEYSKRSGFKLDESPKCRPT